MSFEFDIPDFSHDSAYVGVVEEQLTGSREELERKRRLRAKRYGIEIRSDGHLIKPAEWRHLDESQFADPVNYMYPVHDATHVRAALVYFIRYKNAYKKPQSRLIILTRILRAAIKHGVSVRWDTIKSNFPEIANKLPASIKRKLVGYSESEAKEAKPVDEVFETFSKVYVWLIDKRGANPLEAAESASKVVRILYEYS